MSWVSFMLVITGVLLNVAAQLLIKTGTNAVGHFEFSRANILPIGWRLATEPHIVGALTCYVFGVVVWVLALSRVQVSIAYPMLSMGMVLNAVAAWYLFDEPLNATKFVGMTVIILGVIIISRT